MIECRIAASGWRNPRPSRRPTVRERRARPSRRIAAAWPGHCRTRIRRMRVGATHKRVAEARRDQAHERGHGATAGGDAPLRQYEGRRQATRHASRCTSRRPCGARRSGWWTMMVMIANRSGVEVGYLAGRYPGVLGHLYSPGAQRGPWPFLPYALDNGRYGAWAKIEWLSTEWRDYSGGQKRTPRRRSGPSSLTSSRTERRPLKSTRVASPSSARSVFGRRSRCKMA